MDERFFAASKLSNLHTVLSKKGSVFIEASCVRWHWTFATSLLSDRRSRRQVEEEQDGIGQYKETG
jgi:hypothetical protein